MPFQEAADFWALAGRMGKQQSVQQDLDETVEVLSAVEGRDPPSPASARTSDTCVLGLFGTFFAFMFIL